MRSLLISLVIILTAPSLLPAEIRAQNRARKSSRELVGLVGPVRSFHMDKEVQGDAAGETPRIPVQVMAFDEKGNTVQQTMHNPDGSLKWRLGWDHLYDAAGREVKTYYYNEKGVLNTGVSDYDEKGLRSETTQVNPNSSINHIRSYFYDDRGNTIQETYRWPGRWARTNILRSYDENGQVTEEVFYVGDGLDHKSVFAYDERGNMTELTLFGKDASSRQVFRKHQNYDVQGNVKEAINYDSNNSIVSNETFTYEFDDRGNWIKRITARELIKDGRWQIESETVHRTITYF